MDEIKKLISDIDLLMTHISSDTNKTKLPQLNAKLIELSKIYAENKKEQVRLKGKIEREMVMLVEQRSQRLYTQYKEEYEKELEEAEEKDKKKIKFKKPSNIDIKDMADLEMMTLKEDEGELSIVRKKEEADMIVVYLDVILKSYFERVQSVKFQSNLENKFNSYRNDNEQ